MTDGLRVAHEGAPGLTAGGLAERRTWAALAIGSLAMAGVFAILLAFSRLPGSAGLFPWPLNFFGKGLVIHVIFLLIVWFLNFFALLCAMAAAEIAPAGMRFGWLGGAGAGLATLSFPLLFLPAFSDAEPMLVDYVPAIQHPVYFIGLAVFAGGVLLPALRLLLNLRGRFSDMPPLAAGMSAGAAIYIMALLCFAWTTAAYWGEIPSFTAAEQLFWAGGHVLQFLFCLLMLTGWYLLSRASLGESGMDAGIYRVSAMMLMFFVLPAPLLLKIFGVDSAWYREAFTRLQFGMVLPAAIAGFGLLQGIMRAKAAGPLPWRNPAFAALILSLIVFGVGGLMGNLITGSDTRTPAHYHSVLTGVNLAVMGMMLSICLPALGKGIRGGAGVVAMLWIYGLGQLVASLGMFWAGGGGAARKTAGAGDMTGGAAIGMYVHGIGALFAVIGGVMFAVIVIKALARRSDPKSG